VSSPGESHPQALSEPYVRLSPHTAPSVQSPRPLGNLAFVQDSSPQVGLIRTPAEPPAPLRSSPITEPSALLRTLLPPCPASVLWLSWCPPLERLPSHQDDGFSCSLSKPAAEFLPPVCRAPVERTAGPCVGPPPPHPAAITTPRFRRRLGHLDTSSAVHLRSTPRRSPDAVIAAPFPATLTTRALSPQQLVAV
jgi:hypothetical protein